MSTRKKLVKLPIDALEWLTKEAERNMSTANSEIVRAIRQRMDDEQREKAAG